MCTKWIQFFNYFSCISSYEINVNNVKQYELHFANDLNIGMDHLYNR